MLTNGEVLQLKAMCGYSVVGVGAGVYIEYAAVFDAAVQPYTIDYSTTSTTAVVAAVPAATVPIVLASNPTVLGNNVQPLAFAVGGYIVVDVGPNQETSQIQVLTGLTAYVQLTNAHGTFGAYPVDVNGSEYVIRQYMVRHQVIEAQLTAYAPLTAGIQEVIGDVKLYQSERAGRRGTIHDKHSSLISQRTQVRRDICLALGIPYLPDFRKGSSQKLALG